MNPNIRNTFNVIIQIVAILLVGLLSIWFASLFNRESSKEDIIKEIVKEVIIEKPVCPNTTDSFEELKNTGQIVTLAKNLNSYGESGTFINNRFVVVKSTGSGSQIACGYLYVKGHAGKDRPLQLKWEHPYVKPGQFGGHLKTDLSIIPAQDEKANKFLFDLSAMGYWVDNSDTKIRKADWSALLNVSDEIEFEVALNTIDKMGVLDEVSIVYKCWSPETGRVTSDCKLEVSNK